MVTSSLFSPKGLINRQEYHVAQRNKEPSSQAVQNICPAPHRKCVFREHDTVSLFLPTIHVSSLSPSPCLLHLSWTYVNGSTYKVLLKTRAPAWLSMNGCFPTVSLGIPRAPSRPCSARADAMAVFRLGVMMLECVFLGNIDAVKRRRRSNDGATTVTYIFRRSMRGDVGDSPASPQCRWQIDMYVLLCCS